MRALVAWMAVSIVLVPVACNRRVDARPLPEITSQTEEGMCDLVFGIEKHETLASGTQKILVAGLHRGVRVAFEVELVSTGPVATEDQEMKFESGDVHFRSVGTASDAFVRALDSIYGTQRQPSRMASQVEFLAIAFEGDPADLSSAPVSLKLFFESEVEGSEAEVFLNVYLEDGLVELREKDEEYRAPLVKALSAS